jgi:hypothetical protein
MTRLRRQAGWSCAMALTLVVTGGLVAGARAWSLPQAHWLTTGGLDGPPARTEGRSRAGMPQAQPVISLGQETPWPQAQTTGSANVRVIVQLTNPSVLQFRRQLSESGRSTDLRGLLPTERDALRNYAERLAEEQKQTIARS